MGEPADTEPEPELELELEHAASPANKISTALITVTVRTEWCLNIATSNISCLS